MTGRSCSVGLQAAGELALRLSMSLAAPKVLLLELAERAAVATTVRSTPGACAHRVLSVERLYTLLQPSKLRHVLNDHTSCKAGANMCAAACPLACAACAATLQQPCCSSHAAIARWSHIASSGVPSCCAPGIERSAILEPPGSDGPVVEAQGISFPGVWGHQVRSGAAVL